MGANKKNAKSGEEESEGMNVDGLQSWYPGKIELNAAKVSARFKVNTGAGTETKFTSIELEMLPGKSQDIRSIHSPSYPKRYLVAYPCPLTAYHIERFVAFQDLESEINQFKAKAESFMKPFQAFLVDNSECRHEAEAITSLYNKLVIDCSSLKIVKPSFLETFFIYRHG